MMECLTNIIGLSNRDCACFPEKEGEDVSKSGLYIDDLYEQSNILALTDSMSCDDEIWGVIAGARASAITDFVRDLTARIGKANTKLINYKGQLGKVDKATKLLTPTGTSVGVQINGNNGYKAAYFAISSIGLKINTAGTYTVKLFRDDNMVTPLESWPVVAVANKPSYLDQPYTFPLFSKTGNPYNYFLLYEPAGARPYDTATWCCSGKDKNWSKLVNVLGAQSSDLVTFELKDKPMNGLIINLSIHCNIEWVCSDFDYTYDPWAATMAKTIHLLSIAKVYNYINSTGNVNRYTVLEKPEYLLGKMKSLAKQIDERYDYMAAFLPDEALHCWSCDNKVVLGEIIV